MYKPSFFDSNVRIWFTAGLFLAASFCPLWADSEVPPQTTIGQCRSDFDARVNQCITTFLDSKGKGGRDTAGFQRCYYQSIFFWAICVNDNLGASDRIPQLSLPGSAPVSAAPPTNMPLPPTGGAVTATGAVHQSGSARCPADEWRRATNGYRFGQSDTAANGWRRTANRDRPDQCAASRCWSDWFATAWCDRAAFAWQPISPSGPSG